MKEQIIQKLQIIFREVFDEPDLIIDENLDANQLDMWDSLTHVDMLTMVEEEFEIVIPFEKVIEFDTAGDLIKYIIELKGGV